MKKYIPYLSVVIIILIFGFWVIKEASSRSEDENLAYITIDGEKRKVPDFSFTNQNGETITNKDYEGKVYVVEFFFSTCPTICPIMNKNMVEIQRKFYGKDDFGIASFSIDPINDTVEALKAYAEKIGVKHPNWHMMTGNLDDILKLSNKGFSLYVKQEEAAPGGFEHSGFFALVDKEGYLRSRQDANGNPIVFYQGAVEFDEDQNRFSEEQQVGILIEDIQQLLKE
jgi:protein SCO1/2